MILVNGVYTVDKGTARSQNDLMSGYSGPSDKPYAHLHPYLPQLNNKTLQYSYTGPYGPVTRDVGVFYGTAIPSGNGGDIGQAKREGKIGGTIRNIVVNYSSIYLYDGRDIGIRINRK